MDPKLPLKRRRPSSSAEPETSNGERERSAKKSQVRGGVDAPDERVEEAIHGSERSVVLPAVAASVLRLSRPATAADARAACEQLAGEITEDNASELIQAGAGALLVSMLSRHEPATRAAACEALASLSFHADRTSWALLMDQRVGDAIIAKLPSLQGSLQNATNICRLFNNLVVGGTNGAAAVALMDAGAGPAVVSLLRSHEGDAELAQDASRLICSLSSSQTLAARVRDAGACEALLSVIRRHGKTAAVLLAALQAVKAVAADEAALALLLAGKAVGLTVCALDTFPKQEGLPGICAAICERLAQAPGGLKQLLDAAPAKAAVRAVRKGYKVDHAACLRLLCLLAPQSELDRSRVELAKAAAAAVKALRAHPKNSSVAADACSLLEMIGFYFLAAEKRLPAAEALLKVVSKHAAAVPDACSLVDRLLSEGLPLADFRKARGEKVLISALDKCSGDDADGRRVASISSLLVTLAKDETMRESLLKRGAETALSSAIERLPPLPASGCCAALAALLVAGPGAAAVPFAERVRICRAVASLRSYDLMTASHIASVLSFAASPIPFEASQASPSTLPPPSASAAEARDFVASIARPVAVSLLSLLRQSVVGATDDLDAELRRSVALSALQTLRPLVEAMGEDSSEAAFFNCMGFGPLVVRALELHRFDAEVVSSAAAVVSQLAHAPEHRAAVLRDGLTTTFTTAVGLHIKESDIAHSICSTIADTVLGAVGGDKPTLSDVAPTFRSLCVLLAEAHEDDSPVCTEACAALGNLAITAESRSSMEAELIKSCMRAHSDDVALLRRCSQAVFLQEASPAEALSADPADDVSRVARFRKQGVRIDGSTLPGGRLLLAAVSGDAAAICKAALTATGQPSHVWRDAVILAAQTGSVDAVDALLSHPAGGVAFHIGIALRMAAARGDGPLVELLLTKWHAGAPPHGEAALWAAAGNGHLAIVQRLMSCAWRIDPASGDSVALVQAAMHGHTDIVDSLLADGRADPSHALHAPMHYASRAGHAATVARLLMDDRLDLDVAADGDAATPLVEAARGGHVSTLRLLLDDPRASREPVLDLLYALPVQAVRVLMRQPDILRQRQQLHLHHRYTADDVREWAETAWCRRRQAVLSWIEVRTPLPDDA